MTTAAGRLFALTGRQGNDNQTQIPDAPSAAARQAELHWAARLLRLASSAQSSITQPPVTIA